LLLSRIDGSRMNSMVPTAMHAIRVKGSRMNSAVPTVMHAIRG